MNDLEPVGAKLVGLRVLSEDQWQYASDGAPHLAAALDRLVTFPAWYDPDNPGASALTDYQRQSILEADHCGWLNRLDGRLRLGRFLTLRRLGRGGMGVVWMAWDLEKRRYVAIKRVLGETASVRARFRREARICGRLQHPAICRALGFRQSGKAALLVMEYLPGRNLKEEAAARGPLPWTHVAHWAADLLDGLAYAHGRGVIHRDVKPENVMLTPGGRIRRAKLMDMGLAKCRLDPAIAGAAAENLTAAGQIIGTPAYMSPEQWKGGDGLAPESDIYALGGTLYHALAGKPLYRCDSVVQYCTAHIQQKPAPLRQLRPEIPARLDAIVLRMLSKSARQRGTAGQLLAEFQELLDEVQSGWTPATLGEVAPRFGTPIAPQPRPQTRLLTKSPVPTTPEPPAQIVFSEPGDEGQTQPLRFNRATKIWLFTHVLARLIPAGGGWSLYPVGDPPQVRHNGELVRGRRRLAVGDCLRLRDRKWEVELLDPPVRTRTPKAAFEVWLNDQLLAEAEAGEENLIGGSEECDVLLPVGFDLPPSWAVLARTHGRWELHSLTENAFCRDGESLGTSIVFRGPDEVEQNGLRFVFRPGKGALAEEGPATRGSDRSLQLDAGPEPVASQVRESTLYLRCTEACAKAKAGLQAFDLAPTKLGAWEWFLRLLRNWRRPKDAAEELSRLEMELARNPGAIDQIHKLARFCDRYGFDNLSRGLLTELSKRQP